jgi:hypothetical protein
MALILHSFSMNNTNNKIRNAMKYLLILLLAFSTSAFASIIVPPTYNGLADSGDELWTLTDANAVYDDSGFEMLFEYGQFNTSDHEFGFYHYDSNTGSYASMLKIFDATDSVGTDSNLVWDLQNDQALTQYGSMDLTLASGLDFGFYFVSDGDTFFSQSALNPNLDDLFGFYWETDQFANANLYVYGSDNDTGRNHDYMYVGASDVSPTGVQITTVPEPATLALFGLALLGFARRKTE